MKVQNIRQFFQEQEASKEDADEALEQIMVHAANVLQELIDACGCASYHVGRCQQCQSYNHIVHQLTSPLWLFEFYDDKRAAIRRLGKAATKI